MRDRCVINSETGCWEWARATSKSHRQTSGVPVAWDPKTGRVMSVLAIVHRIIGKPNAPMRWRCCRNDLCCKPQHILSGTRADWGRWVSEEDVFKAATPVTVQRRSTMISAGLTKLTPADVIVIRTSSETGRELAKRFGVHCATISRVRRHQTWAEHVAGAWVFGRAA